MRHAAQRSGRVRRGAPAPFGWGLAAATLVVLAGCGVAEVVVQPFRGETPRERHEEALDRAGLGESRLVEAWRRAGARALSEAVEVAPPIVESAWIVPEEPGALGYRIELRRGERLQIDVRGDTGASTPFVELYRLREGASGDPPLLVRWAEEGESALAYDARASAEYLVRIQPELLGGGPIEVEIRTGPSLAFPVLDRTTGNILSFFGDVRDGGARDHHGVDVFAPRGTPVLAATDGTAYRVQETPRGGKVVWIRDPTGDIRTYYAHLDSQVVAQGAEVRAGDVVGLVGNTGNAITTPPHLHFGIYLRRGGPVDPWDFLHDEGRVPASLAVPSGALRRTLVLGGSAEAVVRAGAFRTAAVRARVQAGEPVRVLAATGGWVRVRLPDGAEGYLPWEGVAEARDADLAVEERFALAFP